MKLKIEDYDDDEMAPLPAPETEPETETEPEFNQVQVKQEVGDFQEEEEGVTENSYADQSSYIKVEPSFEMKSEEEETEDDVPLVCNYFIVYS